MLEIDHRRESSLWRKYGHCFEYACDEVIRGATGQRGRIRARMREEMILGALELPEEERLRSIVDMAFISSPAECLDACLKAYAHLHGRDAIEIHEPSLQILTVLLREHPDERGTFEIIRRILAWYLEKEALFPFIRPVILEKESMTSEHRFELKNWCREVGLPIE